MKTSFVLGVLVAATLAGPPLVAQTGTPPVDQKQVDQQRRDAETQMRDAEKQMRQAEQAMRDAARKIEDSTGKMRERIERRVVVFGDHARLGVVLRHEKNPATDAVGAVIEALTPGGPAEEAGLQAGDVITKFDGQLLTTGTVDADEDESAPTARMMDLAKSLTDGQKVALEVRRGDTTLTLTVTARGSVGPKVRVFTRPHVESPEVHVESPEVEDIEIPEIPEIPDIDVDVVVGRSWQDIELVALNADLGEYFGTSEGLLVVRTPKDDGLKLRAGDVILKIGDRTPGSPSKAMRILRSYEGGESVAVQVLRKREQVTLSLQVPEWRLGHQHHVAPIAPVVPAAPPAPVAAPAAPAKVPTRV
jgi:C-terminal processing protease CtpA/Prc